ncbi:hypothetical protein LBW89_10065 [Paenibacillus sp. alder61]|uniref:hypothetical protein n=1 Tax=Paenibacillus sp. alder61 TaxID=2862948 RepID=UPI001CD6C506|nr:hypothetical protein [Paenibacillus sp. alder61]MCA1293365.1 hypothetical protein [Paenibacillus sp. alder61]
MLADPQFHLPPAIITAFRAAISPRFALSGKIAVKKGFISLERVQKLSFDPFFSTSFALELIWVLPTRNLSCRPPNNGLLGRYFNPICVLGKNSG